MASSGIVSVTRGVVDLRVPPATPPGQTWLYQTASPLQLTSTLAAVLCGVRAGKVKGVDFENGTDLVPFDDLSAVSPQGAVVITRNHEEPNPNSKPPGQRAIMVKYPALGGFVPVGAKRPDGSPHPHQGTGFALNEVIAWRTEHSGPPPYGLNFFGRDPKAPSYAGASPEAYGYLELHQLVWDGATAKITKTERIARADLLDGWTMNQGSMDNAIPDGDEFLLAIVGRRPGDGSIGTGVSRWRRTGDDWRPVSYTPVTGPDGSGEPSLVRDIDNSLLFCTRGTRNPLLFDVAGSTHPDYDVRVWRSDVAEGEWRKVIHVRGCVSSSTITLNRAADGTPYVAANLYEVFLHPADRITVSATFNDVSLDPEGRVRGGGWMRETLVIWPLNEARTGLETPIVARGCRGDFGPPPGGTTWRVDHPSGATVRLADAQWHHVLATRILEYGELTEMANPTPQTGTHLEEVVSAGPAIPTWRF